MALSLDILLSDNDILIQDGDFVIGYSDDQHIIDNIAAFNGWWKEYPSDGVGIFQYQNSSGTEQEIEKLIKLQLQSDGYQCDRPDVSFDANGKLIINPNATKI
jgi:hypothetical protein